MSTFWGRKNEPPPPQPSVRQMHVSIWDDGQLAAESGVITFDVSGLMVGGVLDTGRLRFPLPAGVPYGWHVTMTGTASGGRTFSTDVTLAADVDVTLPPLKPTVTLLPVRVEQGRYRTDAGWMVPRFFTCFQAIHLVKTGQLDELRRQLDRGVDASCNGVRFGGSLDWPAIKFSPRDALYWEWFDTVVTEAEQRWMYSEVPFACDWQRIVPDHRERGRWVQDFAAFCRVHPTIWAQMANEPRKNGWEEADDDRLLDLGRLFKALAPGTILSIGDPADTKDYHKKQIAIAKVADYLVLHSSRAEDDAGFRRWVEHLKGFYDSVQQHCPGKALLHDEPMGGASRRQPGRRDNSVVAHVAGAVMGAMMGGYTYLHRPEEDDACPGLLESAFAEDLPGSPDYRHINATLPGSPVTKFEGWEKIRTMSNGSRGWICAVGRGGNTEEEEKRRRMTLADGWSILGGGGEIYRLTDDAGTVAVWTAQR